MTPLKVAFGNLSEFSQLSWLKCSCILGLAKAKFLIAASNCTVFFAGSIAAIAVLFSAFGKSSIAVDASKAIVADVDVFFCAKVIIEIVAIAKDRIVLFIFKFI